MLKYKFLGLLTIAILLISFLNCTTAINPDNKLDPKTNALLKHIMSLGDCSEFEATYILRIIVEQRGNDWDYDFLGRYVDVLAGNQEAKEELDTNIWFQAFVDAFDEDIRAWKHKSLEEKAAALNIKDITSQDEFDAFIENCTSEEQCYIYERLNDSFNQLEITTNETLGFEELDVSKYKNAENKFNNVMAQIYNTVSDTKVEYQIMSNTGTVIDWSNPLKLISDILSSDISKEDKINELKFLNESYADKFTNLTNNTMIMNTTIDSFDNRGSKMLAAGIALTSTGSAVLIVSVLFGNVPGMVVGGILLGLGFLLDGFGITILASNDKLKSALKVLVVLKSDFEGQKNLVDLKVSEAIKSLN